MEDGAPAIPAEVEQERLRALHDLRVLDSGPEPHFDAIARTAATVMAAPRAAIVFVDKDRVWNKARLGLPSPESPRQGTMADLMVVCRDADAGLVPDAVLVDEHDGRARGSHHGGGGSGDGVEVRLGRTVQHAQVIQRTQSVLLDFSGDGGRAVFHDTPIAGAAE